MQVATTKELIVAPATPLGGAMVVIRLSGEGILPLLAAIFKPRKKNLGDIAPRRLYLGDIHDGNDTIDEVVLTYFQAPFSYTGEDMLEITCHASPYIVENIVRICLEKGARMAQPGEFTLRTFLNGKKDMAEAEAVADLLRAETKEQHRLAKTQMKGAFSQELNSLREQLLHFTALLELELDFSEEEVEFANRTQLLTLCDAISKAIDALVASYEVGRKIKNGIATAIAGIPNAGKSSLLNLLTGSERAIVSNIAGTTRDTISETAYIGGALFRFIDTAGIREAVDPIEQEGVKRARHSAQEADIQILLIDATKGEEAALKEQLDLLQTLPQSEQQQRIVVLNKIDLLTEEEKERLKEQLQKQCKEQSLLFSTKTKEGLEALLHLLSDFIGIGTLPPQAIITNARHHTLLLQVQHHLRSVREGLSVELPIDLVTIDLRSAIACLGEITGEAISSSEVLHHIFAHFCIGK